MESRGAVVFVNRGNPEFLVIQHNSPDKHWGFPKGAVEEGESDEETALREIKEETGLDVSLIKGFDKHIKYRVRGRFDKQVMFFLAEAKGKKVSLQEEEVLDFQWLRFEKAMKKLSFDDLRGVLGEAYSFLKNKFFK